MMFFDMGDDTPHLDRLEPLFGKYRDSGWTWQDLIERDPTYVLWVVENVTRLPRNLREALEEALADLPDDTFDGW